MKASARTGIVRLRRRALLTAIYGISMLAISASVAATPGGAARGPATSVPVKPPVITQADKDAAEAQFDKANALFQQKKYAEAQVENDRALKLDPTNVKAVLLQSTLKDKLAGGTAGTVTTAGTDGKIPVLTTQQVSIVRLMELGAADTRVTGRIDPKVVEDFWQTVILKDPLGDKSVAAHTAFTAQSNFMGQAKQIRDSGNMKYISQVTVNTDPATFVTFRNNISSFVLQNCATSDCHGGEKSPGGSFRLLNPATSAEQQYTNFYILSQFANGDGKMLDRETADKSLLLQYALPWQAAVTKHPKADVKKLSGTTDTRATPIFNWIRSLANPKPHYGIDYTVPGATTTASAPAPK